MYGTYEVHQNKNCIMFLHKDKVYIARVKCMYDFLTITIHFLHICANWRETVFLLIEQTSLLLDNSF